MVFHEITRDAIDRALGETREVDQRLVDAQETRRILDRLYGYEVSPVLWKKVMPRLSAGRVQSVATRLVVERERERMAFRAAEWWDLLATFDPDSFEARLVSVDGQRVATGRDFGMDGKLRGEARQLDEDAVRGLAERLDGAAFNVSRVERKPYGRRPSPPFMTSTLQQEASRKLRYSAQTTMRIAQRLYENGYITYMRTDSTTLSESALTAARAQGQERAGGARGDPAVGRPLPHAAGRAVGALARRARALRADLDADDRVADEGRAGADRLAADRGRLERERVRRVRRIGHRDHVPRLPRRVRGRPRRRPRRAGRRRGAAPAEPRGG
jgi:DNA topoisomerase-1